MSLQSRFSPLIRGVVDVLNHVAEHFHRIGSHFSEQDFLVVRLVDDDLNEVRFTFFLFSGRLRRNHTALSFILSVSP